MTLIVKTFLAEVDFGGGFYSVESVPLGVGNKRGKGNGESVFGAEFEGGAEAEEENEELDEVVRESNGFVASTTQKVKVEVERTPGTTEGIESEESGHDEGGGGNDDLVLGHEGETDETDKAESVVNGRIAVCEGVLFFVVEFVENEYEDGLEKDVADTVNREGAIKSDVHIHEGDIGIDVDDDEPKN